MKNLVKKYPLLICIILIGFVLRMYKINTPLLDWHSWRQADTASVTREYVRSDLNPLYPKYHDLSNIPSGFDNPEGYRMVEFPIYNILTAAILKAIPELPLVPTARVISALFSVGTMISIFFLTRSYFGKKAGYIATFFFATIPYSVYYSRTILPEPLMLFASTLSLTTFRYYLKKPSIKLFITSALSLSLAFVLKPFVVFLAPVYLTMLLEERRVKKILFDWKLYIFVIIAIVPFLLWRQWIANFPSGIPASDWLFNSDGIRFRPAWFRWLGYERLTKLILGFVGIIFLPISLINQLKNKNFFLVSWWFGIGLYFIVLATGNVKHDYYQIITTPVIAITLAHAVLILDEYLCKKLNPLLSIAIIGSLVTGTLVLGFSQVKGYYNINHPEYFEAGRAADAILPNDAKVIAPQYGGDTAYLFQINRSGWPIGGYIEEKITAGATHYVTTTYDSEARDLEEKFMIVEKTDEYLIIDLTQRRTEIE